MDESETSQTSATEEKRSVNPNSFLRKIESIVIGEEELTEEVMKHIVPNNVAPNSARLMKKVLIKARKLFDVFKFTLVYKKRSSSGMQFYGMRKYTPEDDASKIDWKTSVRMSAGHEKIDELYLKVYEEEMDLTTFLVLDTSSTMLFGSKMGLKSDLAAEVAATLAYAASVAKTKFGSIVFNDTVREMIPISRGEMQFHRVIRSMCDPKNYWGSADLSKALKYAQESLDGRTMLVVISDFIDLKGDWKTPLKQCSEKFDSVLGVMVRDPLDNYLPEGLGVMRLSAPYRHNGAEVNMDAIRDIYNTESKKERDEIKKVFNTIGAGFIMIDTVNDDYIKPFLEYFAIWAYEH